jgi:ATP-dependent protease HslVU (ClpYQ) peptidase subunit
LTTIAYDGVWLAADRCMTLGMSRSKTEAKIRKAVIPGRGRTPFGFGACGDGFHAIAVLNAIQHGTEFPDWTRYGIEDPSSPLAIACQKGKVWLINSIGDWMRIHERTMAMGGGFEFAIGALEAGATAIQAVKIAEKRSAASSHGIDSFCV